jgi:hypothetical protein
MIVKILIIYACIAWTFDVTLGLLVMDDNDSWPKIIIKMVIMPFIVICAIGSLLIEGIKDKRR